MCNAAGGVPRILAVLRCAGPSIRGGCAARNVGGGGVLRGVGSRRGSQWERV